LAVALNICKLRIAKRYQRVKQNSTKKCFYNEWLNGDNDLIVKVKSMAGIKSMSVEDFI
jgi:hypothetical protein